VVALAGQRPRPASPEGPQSAWLTDPSPPEAKRNADLSKARSRLDIWRYTKTAGICWKLRRRAS
jgi:hypothetical protein